MGIQKYTKKSVCGGRMMSSNAEHMCCQSEGDRPHNEQEVLVFIYSTRVPTL
jgi:hypothetical protein